MERLALGAVHAVLEGGRAAAVEVLLALPQLEEEEVAGALGDLGQRVVLYDGEDVVVSVGMPAGFCAGGRRDLDDMGVARLCHYNWKRANARRDWNGD